MEELIARHPSVAEAAAIAAPDPRSGERTCAFIVFRPGAVLALADLTAFLRGVNFDFDKYNIRPDAAPILDEAARTLQQYGDVTIYVDGYTDSIGSDAYNQRLSERRANAVKEYLQSHGVAASRMTARGFGKTNPVASNETAEGRAQNRRVELIVNNQ